jgi:hypothetical protein
MKKANPLGLAFFVDYLISIVSVLIERHVDCRS